MAKWTTPFRTTLLAARNATGKARSAASQRAEEGDRQRLGHGVEEVGEQVRAGIGGNIRTTKSPSRPRPLMQPHRREIQLNHGEDEQRQEQQDDGDVADRLTTAP